MVAEVIKFKRQKPSSHNATPLSFWVVNLVFLLDAVWHVWGLATNHNEFTLVSKFLLGFTLALLLKQQLRQQLPVNILIAILFCLAGDVLLQPLDLNYADMSADRPVHFILGVICFCVAYGHLMLYYMDLNPGWLVQIKTQPWPLLVNLTVTLSVLIWMTFHNQAPAYLLIVLWLYSPIVVGAATLALYTRANLSLIPFLALVAGSNAIVFSDTVIGLTVFAKISMPGLSNPVWILSTYILGIFLIFNAVLAIEKRSACAIR
jgi:hypothetical protein